MSSSSEEQELQDITSPPVESVVQTDESSDTAKGRLQLELEVSTDVSADPHASLGKTYSSVQSPLSDDGLLDLPLEIPQTGLERTRKRQFSLALSQTLSRDLVLQTVAHTLAGFTGEFVGTFLLTLCCISSTASAVMAGALSGLWEVAVICGLGVASSIYLSAHISDAHLNPAITLAFAIVRFRVFSWKKIPVYLVAQLLGGFMAGVVQYGVYHHAIARFEQVHGIERGRNGSELSAMVFGEYFPNPSLYPHDNTIISPIEAMFVEAWSTGLLVFVIFAFTDKDNTTVGSSKRKVPVPVPILIATTVIVLISLYAPMTQACFNPARDFGPRLFAAMAGWGRIAIPGPRNGFWVYIIGPLIGSPVGAILYDLGAAKAGTFKKQVKRRQSRPHLPRYSVP